MLPSIIWDHFRWSWETIYLEHTHTHAQMASKHMPSQAITNPIKKLIPIGTVLVLSSYVVTFLILRLRQPPWL